ncbi:MAG: TolC family protein [Janthinobacterium lividum]
MTTLAAIVRPDRQARPAVPGPIAALVAGMLVGWSIPVSAQPLVTASPAQAQAQALVIASPAQAVAEALNRSPALRGAGAARAAVRGDALAAPLRPNPDASIVVENFGGMGGRGNYREGRAIETTLGLSQRIELGGKRGARIGLAGRATELAGLDYEAARLDLARDVVTALADAEVAFRTIAVERDRARLAAETLRIARGRVDAGKEPLLQARRAEVTLATATVAVERATRDADIALRNLAVLVGVPQLELAPRRSWFDDIGPAPSLPLPADPLDRVAPNPDILRLEAAITQQRANIALQRANAIPDVTLQGYVRRFEEGRETAFVAGASIPLPFNDRNQAGIARAQAELLRAEAEADRGRLAIATALGTAERRAGMAWRTVQTLRRSALPAAEQAARLALGGFTEGKFTFLEVLDAQRALADTRVQHVDALREFHARRAEAERLRGREAGLQVPGREAGSQYPGLEAGSQYPGREAGSQALSGHRQ